MSVSYIRDGHFWVHSIVYASGSHERDDWLLSSQSQVWSMGINDQQITAGLLPFGIRKKRKKGKEREKKKFRWWRILRVSSRACHEFFVLRVMMDTAYSESETTYTFSQAAAQSQSRDLYRLLCVGHTPASAVRDVDQVEWWTSTSYVPSFFANGLLVAWKKGLDGELI